MRLRHDLFARRVVLTAGKSAFDKEERWRSLRSFSGQRSFDSEGAIEQRGCTYGFNIQTYPSWCSYCNDTRCWQCLFSALDGHIHRRSHDLAIAILIYQSLYHGGLGTTSKIFNQYHDRRFVVQLAVVRTSTIGPAFLKRLEYGGDGRGLGGVCGPPRAEARR